LYEAPELLCRRYPPRVFAVPASEESRDVVDVAHHCSHRAEELCFLYERPSLVVQRADYLIAKVFRGLVVSHSRFQRTHSFTSSRTEPRQRTMSRLPIRELLRERCRDERPEFCGRTL